MLFPSKKTPIETEKDSEGRYLVLIIVILAQVALVVASASWSKVYRDMGIVRSDFVDFFIIFITFPLGLAGIFLIREIMHLAKREADAREAEAHLEESKAMISVLRAQRHDFMNHIQVIYGLVQLGKKENVREYIESLTGEMEAMGRVTALEVPELTALLMKKTAEGYRKGINFETEALTGLRNIVVPGRDLVRTVGNIIDNAFHALEVSGQEEKDASVSLLEQDGKYLIKIWNNGPPIPEEIKEKIFDDGITTKTDEGHGYGLAIVHDLVEKNHGKISFTTDAEEGTTFVLEFRSR